MKLKLKYFIRGLGIGIVFTAIVMSLSLQASRSRIIRENALTKEEIMEKAMGYGMILDSSDDTTSVEQNEGESNDVVNQENDDKDNDVSLEKDKVQSNVDSSEDTESSEAESDEKDKDIKDEDINDEDIKDEVTKDEVTDESSDKDDSLVTIDYIPIKITSGMTATSVGNLLKEKGVIEDPDEFRIYMSEQGYSSKIRTGEYLIPVEATYKKIADIITRKH